jgi:hypothetical protein
MEGCMRHSRRVKKIYTRSWGGGVMDLEIKTTPPALNVKTGFGNWILGFEICL